MKKTTMLTILGCLMLLVGTFIVVNHFNNVNAKEESETIVQRIHSFTEQLNKTLHQEEGARITTYERKSPKNNDIIITIEIPTSKHNDKQTNDNIRNIVERLATEYELDSISIKTKIKATR
ncbi:hypothetical protein [Lentibacillus jeotgali]|uniref:hypothetical protein n=1 Tax=Lentibacillus jeotgali TaxID=558169 RepID=UPI0002626FA9|nr:hypothetical protein [Lentibacillus jeotgali]